MCCCCFDIKRKVATGAIGCLAILVGISGIAMMICAFLLTNTEFMDKIIKAKAFEDVEDAKNFIFYGLVIFAAFTICIAFCGCCFKWCRNRCFAIIYGTILLPVWIFVVIVGGIAAGASVASGDTVEDTCKDLAGKLSFNVNADGDFDLSSIGASTGISSVTSELGAVNGQLTIFEQENLPLAVQADALNLGLLEPETTVYDTSGDLVISFNIYQEIFINQEMCTRNCPCYESDKMS